MKNIIQIIGISILLLLPSISNAQKLPKNVFEIAPDGCWTWFNDERAIFHKGYLYCGYVMSNGKYGISRFNPSNSTSIHSVISTTKSEQKDDHNNPSLTVLPDNRLLIMYAKHGIEPKFYSRVSKNTTPATVEDWSEERTVDVEGKYCYNNTFRLTSEKVNTDNHRIYGYHREINWDPTLMYSDDNGESWSKSFHFIDAGGKRQRPYVKYWSNGKDRIDILYTDGHPDDIEKCSIYHLYYESGKEKGTGRFNKSNGEVLKTLPDIISGDPIDHDGDQLGATGIERGTLVYKGSEKAWNSNNPEGPNDWLPGGRAWTLDISSRPDGRTICAFQVQRKDVLNEFTDVQSFRNDRIYYYYAIWSGNEWQKRCIAQAGRPLYGESHPSINRAQRNYAGGMAIDPDDPNIVYISSNAANPFDLNYDAKGFTNTKLNKNDRYELYKGVTTDGGLTFSWTPVTINSEKDNLRPIVPANHGRDNCVVWLQGDYHSYKAFETKVLVKLGKEKKISLKNLDAEIDASEVKAKMKKVADWQMAHLNDMYTRPWRQPNGGWVNAAFLVGLSKWAAMADTDDYFEWMKAVGAEMQWNLEKRQYHADDHCVGQMYCDLYRKYKDDKMLEPTIKQFDFIMYHPSQSALNWETPFHINRWSWCDALFMSPPVWAKLYNITGEKKYLDFMVSEFKVTTDFLFDKKVGLYYREERYKTNLDNGTKVSWSRGNGWVSAGLVNILNELDAEQKEYKYFLKIYKQMAKALPQLQDPKGHWAMSLLGQEFYPTPETSGTAFFTYGLAWGINQGILDRNTFEPSVKKAWNALCNYVNFDGMLGYVQPVGAAPGQAWPDRTEVYGAGAFLSAGSEVYKLFNK